MKTSNMLNKIATKMKETNKQHKNDKIELCESVAIFTSEVRSVHGLNNRYISHSEYDQLVALQDYLRQQQEVDVEKLTKYILGSNEKNLRFIKSVLEAIPDLIQRMIIKNQESDIRGFVIEFVVKTRYPSTKGQKISQDIKEDKKLNDEDDCKDCVG